jgi:hypothetical protein
VFDIYARAIRLAKSSSLKVALLESTRNPKIDAMLPDTEQRRQTMQQYQSDVIAFSDKEGVPYWNLSEAAMLTEEDFADQNHLRERDARRRFTRALADQVAPLLMEKET